MMMMMMIEYNILRLHLCERLYKISINTTPLCNRDTKEATQISVNFEFAVPRFDKSVGFLAWTLSWPMKLAYIIARLAKDNMFKVISWIKASPSNCHLAERPVVYFLCLSYTTSFWITDQIHQECHGQGSRAGEGSFENPGTSSSFSPMT